MALKAGEGLQRWEIAVTKKLVGEFRRRSRSLAREEFDDLVQGVPGALDRGAPEARSRSGGAAHGLHGPGDPQQTHGSDP